MSWTPWVCQSPGHLQSLSGSKVLTPFKNHTQATQSLASAVHATMRGFLPCALPWKGAGKESGNNALPYHCKNLGNVLNAQGFLDWDPLYSMWGQFDNMFVGCSFWNRRVLGLVLFIASQLDTAVHGVLAHCHQLHLAWKSLTILQQRSSLYRHGVAAAFRETMYRKHMQGLPSMTPGRLHLITYDLHLKVKLIP